MLLVVQAANDKYLWRESALVGAGRCPWATPTTASCTVVFPSNLRCCMSPVIPAANRVLVLASDGLWDAVDNEEATEIALKWRKRGAEYAAQALCMEAYARGSQDNITAVVSLWVDARGGKHVCVSLRIACGACAWGVDHICAGQLVCGTTCSWEHCPGRGAGNATRSLLTNLPQPAPLRAPLGRSYFFVPPPRPNSSATARLAAVAAAWHRWLSSAGTASLDRWRLPTLPALPPSVPRWGVVGLLAAAAVAAGANWRWPAALAPT